MAFRLSNDCDQLAGCAARLAAYLVPACRARPAQRAAEPPRQRVAGLNPCYQRLVGAGPTDYFVRY